MTDTEIDLGGHPGPRRKLNPVHLAQLENMRHNFAALKIIDWPGIEKMTQEGTSQGEISRLTGINQGWISRRLRRMKGVAWADMDSARRERGAKNE